MSEPPVGRRGSAERFPAARIALWAGTAAIGAYLIVTGVFGILAKG